MLSCRDALNQAREHEAAGEHRECLEVCFRGTAICRKNDLEDWISIRFVAGSAAAELLAKGMRVEFSRVADLIQEVLDAPEIGSQDETRGHAYRLLGYLHSERGTADLRTDKTTAIGAWEKATRILTREHDPESWAGLKESIGVAELEIARSLLDMRVLTGEGVVDSVRGLVDSAIARFTDALTVYSEPSYEEARANTTALIVDARNVLNALGP